MAARRTEVKAGECARVQAVPLPLAAVSFQHDGREICAYRFSPLEPRPYLFPVVGPAGRFVTRLGHPHDPVGHGHHRSIWVGHADVAGHDFWQEGRGRGRIIHQGILELSDGPDSAAVVAGNVWITCEGEPLLREVRRTTVRPLERGELLIDVEMVIAPLGEPVVLGDTPFGLLAVRVAKTMSVADGGGRIVSSDGAVGEAAIFWKRARWCDYSGPVTPSEWNGIAFFDHPSNPDHPTVWHVRSDGWMGASVTKSCPRMVSAEAPLELAYRLFVHSGDAESGSVEERYRQYAGTHPCS
jgi:hypothetical protein